MGPDTVTGYGELGRREGDREPAEARPIGPNGLPLPLSALTLEQKQAMLRASPRINSSRIFLPGSFYDPQVRPLPA